MSIQALMGWDLLTQEIPNKYLLTRASTSQNLVTWEIHDKYILVKATIPNLW
jgi:hypothetical protein